MRFRTGGHGADLVRTSPNSPFLLAGPDALMQNKITQHSA